MHAILDESSEIVLTRFKIELAIIFELDDGATCFSCHVVDRILIAEPIRA